MKMNIMRKITARNLILNKKRTLVTVIGVMLSMALFVAVTSVIVSFQTYLVNLAVHNSGDWQGYVNGLNIESIESLSTVKGLNVYPMKNLGYSEAGDKENQLNYPRRYFSVIELTPEAREHFNINVTEGRLPENANEIVITENSYTGREFKLGDKLKLDLGKRTAELPDGTTAESWDITVNGYSEEAGETIEVAETREYTISGFMSILDVDYGNSASHTAFTIDDTDDTNAFGAERYNAVLIADKGVNIVNLLPEITEKAGLGGADNVIQNHELLRFMGYSDSADFNAILYGIGITLAVIITIGSISLIYNAFSISVTERSKQFGVLSGTGATAKQIRHSVFFEALLIGVCGIPLGIALGLGGIGTTLNLLSPIFATFMNYDNGEVLPLTLTVSWEALALAAAVSLATIFISVFIPARRASKHSAIDAIRQTSDIKINPKKLKTGLLVRKFFGFEGELAVKNLKRSKRRYRATVVSLFFSVLLTITASGFQNVMLAGTSIAYTDYNYDVMFMINGNASYDDKYGTEKIAESITKIPGAEAFTVARAFDGYLMDVEVAISSMDDLLVKMSHGDDPLPESGKEEYNIRIRAINNAAFSKYLQELGLSETEMKNNPNAVIHNNVEYVVTGPDGSSAYSGKLLKELPETLDVIFGDEHHYVDFRNYSANGEYMTQEENAAYEAEIKRRKEAAPKFTLTPVALTEKKYIGLSNSAYATVDVLVSNETFDKICESFKSQDGLAYSISGYIKTENPAEVKKEIDLLYDDALNYYSVNIAERLQTTRNIVFVVEVFTNGFVILIALIGVATVFNTVSTNANLRRREFAMLKSVGMSPKSFKRMINLECAFLGLKSLVFGIPAGFAVAFFLNFIMLNSDVGIAFNLPWASALLSAAGVLVIVFVTMWYSMIKIRKDNIIDVLRSENM